MALAMSTLVGLILGPAIFWLSRYVPARIEAQEAAWLEQLADTHRTPSFRFPAFFGSAAFWVESARIPLFWITVTGAPVVALMFAWRFEGLTMLPFMVFLGLAMFCMAITDHYSQYLPDVMTLGVMWAGLLLQLSPDSRTVGIEASIIGAAAGYLVLWVIAKLFMVIRKQDGLGHGDMKLMAAAGAWLGPFALPTAILIGSVMALLYHGAKLLRRESGRHDLFAFGPWLIAGIVITAIVL